MSKLPCYACGKDVPERTISLCNICSKPLCRSCETLLGDLLLCAECNEMECQELKDLNKEKP